MNHLVGYFFIILSVLSSCSGMKDHPTLNEDPLVNEYFTPEEIQDLQTILTVMDSAFLGNEPFSEYTKRVEQTIQEVRGAGTCCGFLIAPKEEIELLNSLSESTFSKLFTVTKVYDHQSNIRLSIEPQTADHKSELTEFISKIDHPEIDRYIELVSQIGQVSISVLNTCYPKMDPSDPKQRLITAIDFLVFNARDEIDQEKLFDLAQQKSSLRIFDYNTIPANPNN